MVQLSYGLADFADSTDAEADYWSDADWSDDDWSDDEDLGEVLRAALHEDYLDASPAEMDDALAGVLESMSPAESFNFAKALSQIQRGAGQVLKDPTFGQIARGALPVLGGAVGTVVGGPAGTALGSSLGQAAAGALPAGRQQRPTAAPAPAVAGGSAAAARGLVLTQQPEVLKGLLALAMGQHGTNTVNGVPVASIMSMLSSVFSQAAADADELMYAGDTAGLDDASLYSSLLDAENDELAEVMEGF